MSSDSTESTYHPAPGDVLDPKLKIASLLCNNEVKTDTPASPDDSIIIQGMKEKKRILSAYQDKFGAGHPDSINTQKKGKTANDILLTHTRMRHMYLHNLIITVIKEYRVQYLTCKQRLCEHGSQGALLDED
jgi:hypothetical protein